MQIINPVIMKKFIVLISLLGLPLATWACAVFPIVHNYYMMNVINTEQTEPESPDFQTSLASYWQAYTGVKEGFFDDDCALLIEAAKLKKDAEMLAYVRHIAKYQHICERRKEQWDYPSKDELALQKAQIQLMRKAALNYSGQRLAAQYTLLLMRSYLLDANAKGILVAWTMRASRLPTSIYKEMCRNIYAYALLNSGRREEALAIYVSQGDAASIQWATKGFEDYDGIRSFYHENPNSPALRWLVQNFVNNVQEAVDDEPYMEPGDKESAFKREASNFVAFAERVVREGKSYEPALWKTASAMISYLNGDLKKAEEKSRMAMTMSGTLRERDNARAIHLLAVTALMREGQPFDAEFVAKELRFLDGKCNPKSFELNYYGRVLDRIMTQNIIGYYAKRHDINMAVASRGMCERFHSPADDDEFQYSPGNARYLIYEEYFCDLDSMTADQLRDYMAFINKKHYDDALEAYILTKNSFRDANYFNDLLGTKLIAEGRFAEAIPVLKKVPLDYVDHQGISFYMVRRDYKKPRWLVKQPVDDEWDDYGERSSEDIPLTSNQKIAFCEEMNSLEQRYKLANNATRSELAMQLAVRYYQASCYGDCWYLTHYDKLYGDSARAWEKDYARQTMAYLDVAKQDKRLRQEALYARAFVQNSLFLNGFWVTYDVGEDYPLTISDEAWRLAYDELLAYIRKNPTQVADYVTKCDIVRKEMRLAGMAYSR